jgi:hypothetical protein
MTYCDQINHFVGTSTSRSNENASRRARGIALNAILTPAILAAVAGLWPSPAASQTADPPQAIAVCAQNFPTATELACGAGSNSTGGGTTAIGVNAFANANNATALGSTSKATASGSTAVGIIAAASGSFSTAVGNGSTATGVSGTAVGDASKAAANFGSAFGEHSTAGGPNSTAVGGNSTANFANSTALGAGAATTAVNQIAIGTTTSTYQLPGVTSATSASAQTGVVSIITSDSTGHLATIPAGANANAWLLSGNTVVPADFIGTNNPAPFVVKTSGQEHMRLTSGGDLGVGTTNPTARTEISHSDFTPNTVALRVSNTNTTGNGFTESAIGFNVALGNNPDFFATRIYSKYDGTSVGDGRISMQLRGNTGFQDVLNVKLGMVGINTITPAHPLHVNGTVQLGLAGLATDHLCYTGTQANARPLANALDKLEYVRGVSFDWNDQYRAIGGSSERREIGVLAQEVELVFPELVSQADDGYKRVSYDRLTAVLIEAVKDLRKENDALKKRTEALERAITEP